MRQKRAIAAAIVVTTFMALPARATWLKSINDYLTPPSQPEPRMDWSGDSLSAEQLKTLGHLAWPQSRAALTSRIGYPAQRDSGRDYYYLADGDGWRSDRQIAIVYSGDRAVAVEGL
jgi:hypothetical protein